MNIPRQVEVHYINTGFPYTITESFMDFFEGLTYAQADFALSEALNVQGSSYLSMMNSNSYKYEYSGPGGNSYYNLDHAYDVNDDTSRLDANRGHWENTTLLNDINLHELVEYGDIGTNASMSQDTHECFRPQQPTVNNHQVGWEDNIDPDNMTYEELLDLSEAVGTQSRGLSQERISLLPVLKYKCRLFSKRKGRGERCVICQMEYKRGDRQMTLPCKHIYHSACVSKWLSINKACPVCFADVQ